MPVLPQLGAKARAAAHERAAHDARRVPGACRRSARDDSATKFRDAHAEHRDRHRRRAVAESSQDVGIEPPDTLLGLYQGTPLTERQWAHGNALPDKITLFQLPIEDESDDEDDLVVAIGETLIHEIGHYFGLSEEEIEEIEERYWRGERIDDEGEAWGTRTNDPLGAPSSA